MALPPSVVTDLADQRRCKSNTPQGQCRKFALEGSDHCQFHGGVDLAPTRRLRRYLLTSAEEQGLYDRYAADDGLKSLREEIAILRMMLQNTLGWAQSTAEKMNAYKAVSHLMVVLERLSKTNQSLDEKLGNMVSKPALFRLGRELAQAIIDRLEGVPNYESIIEALIGDVARLIQDIEADVQL